ncbi:MAG: carboxylating nicotinate-nucleotide diphosphorylase [Candidatus Omnitrophica bacterium]|nr:carboxylating nicotinate-nucleotide diphosphorylase [Candidatus Omnitrophota bacterium]
MIGLEGDIDAFLKSAIQEDLGPRDLSSSLIPPDTCIKADAIFKEQAVLCGLPIAERIFRIIDSNVRFLPVANEGELIERGRAVFYVEGDARSILSSERLALNILGRLSGIATITKQFVDKVSNTKAKILDTRKTTPLLRKLERYAVRTGGGTNHRFGLFDGVLIKDNHLATIRNTPAGIVRLAKQRVTKNIPVGIEVKNLEDFESILHSEPHYILLDNFSTEQLAEAVEIRNKTNPLVMLEASGGVNLETVEAIAATGVDRISIGFLTHSVKNIDISMNLI